MRIDSKRQLYRFFQSYETQPQSKAQHPSLSSPDNHHSFRNGARASQTFTISTCLSFSSATLPSSQMLLPNTLLTLLLTLAPIATPSPAPAPHSLSVRSPVNDAKFLKTSDGPPPPPPGPRPLEVAQQWFLQCQPHRLDWANSQLPPRLRSYANRCEHMFVCRVNLMVMREGFLDLPISEQCHRECRCVDTPRSGSHSSSSSSSSSSSRASSPSSPQASSPSSPRSLFIRSPVTDVEPFTASPKPPSPHGGPRPLEVAPRRPLECQPHWLNWTNSHLPLHLRLYANQCESIYHCRDNLMTPSEGSPLLDQGIWEQCEKECTCMEQPPPGPRPGTRPPIPASNPASGHQSHPISIRAAAKKPNPLQRPPRPPRDPRIPQAPRASHAPQTPPYSRVQEGILRCKPHIIDWRNSYLRFATLRCEELSQCVGLDMVQVRGTFDAQIWRQCQSLCECKPQAPVEPYPLHMALDPTLPSFHALGPSSHLLGQRSLAPEPDRPSSSLHALAIRAPVPGPDPNAAPSLASTGIPQPFRNDRPRRLFAAQPHAPPPARRWSLECAPHSLDWRHSNLRVRAETCGDLFECFGREMTQVRGEYDALVTQQCERECRCRDSEGEAGGTGAGAGGRRRGRGRRGQGGGRGLGAGSPVQGVS